jgi:uncharacterized membrane protein
VTYLWLKVLHILSATVLFGTGLGIAFFCWSGYRSALRSGEIAVLRSALRWTVIADACLIAPAVVYQPVSGLVLMKKMGWPMVSPWSEAVWALFVLVGACWLPVVAIQVWLRDEAERAESVAALSSRFHRRFRSWFALGVPAFGGVIVLFYLMAAKPLAVG